MVEEAFRRLIFSGDIGIRKGGHGSKANDRFPKMNPCLRWMNAWDLLMAIYFRELPIIHFFCCYRTYSYYSVGNFKRECVTLSFWKIAWAPCFFWKFVIFGCRARPFRKIESVCVCVCAWLGSSLVKADISLRQMIYWSIVIIYKWIFIDVPLEPKP